MVQKLSEIIPETILYVIDSFTEPLKASLAEKPKENATQNDKDRLADQVRSTLKAIVAISHIRGIQDSAKFTSLLKSISSTPNLDTLFQSLNKKHEKLE